jgi:hypothetical protein
MRAAGTFALQEGIAGEVIWVSRVRTFFLKCG